MSANNIVLLPRHRQLIVASDGASYDWAGVVSLIASKIRAMPHWPGVITGTGEVAALEWIALSAEMDFATFDDAVAGIEAALPGMVRDSGHDLQFEIALSGWSHARRRPESYSISTIDNGGPSSTPEQDADSREAGLLAPWKLMARPTVSNTPVPTTELLIASNYEGISGDANPEHAKRVLRLMLEMQRRFLSQGRHVVGGHVEMAVVTPDGVEKAIVHKWTEDREGEMIRPQPIIWQDFRESIGLPRGISAVEQDALRQQLADLDRQLAVKQAPSVIPQGLSRLQRERAEKKQRKAKLRIVS